MNDDNDGLVDDLVRSVIAQYTTLAFCPPFGKYTIISIGSGSKCLPTDRLPRQGDALHDSHAEVLSRRAAVRWFVEEIARLHHNGSSDWISKAPDDKYVLRESVRIHLYISNVPCGDASTRLLASQQNESMASLKDSTAPPIPPANSAARGRDNYSLYGVLRTKPGRADSPPTLCMSCSDKIASWNVLGIQGALFSLLFRQLYLTSIIIGGVREAEKGFVKEECERALWGRSTSLQGLPAGFSPNKPIIRLTSVNFMHSRSSIPADKPVDPCHESLCWVADSTTKREVLINGLRRGVSPKQREKGMNRPTLSKLSLFRLFLQTQSLLCEDYLSTNCTYFEAKQAAKEYQAAKEILQSEGAPFSGWVKSGKHWESFDYDGLIKDPALVITSAA